MHGFGIISIKKIVSKYNGNVSFSSNLEEFVVNISIPLPQKPELNIREENIMKICICDDEKDFIHNFQLLLKQYSKKHKNINQFNSFENENDLLSYFYSQNDIDILFLDIKFQTYSGIEIAKKIRDINPSVILIFLTSFSEYALSGYKVKAF